MAPAAFGKTIAAIYDAVLDDERRPAALQAVAEYAEAAGASFILIDKRTGYPRTAEWWGVLGGTPQDYQEYYGKIDPYCAARQSAPIGSWVRIADLLPQTLLSHDEWYNDFILTGGVRDILGSKLHETASHIALIGLHLAIGDREPFPRNPAELTMMMDPLCKAARLKTGLIEMGYRSAIAHEALDRLSAGIIFADGGGQVLRANPSAERILTAGDGLSLTNGRLCARRNFETVKLAALIAAAASDAEPSAGCMLLGRTGGGASYVVRVAPVGVALAAFDRPVAMVSITAPAESRVSERELSELYGLSRAESRIAVALARGKRPADIADEFGVQITTVRTQLSAILQKLGMERQSDIVRLLSAIAI
jgi:DNA-binding CsgD family transcriptional regulator/PAS domain-containing protein